MADIAQLERRITAALGRIETGLERRAADLATANAAAAAPIDADLQAELAEERMVNAQLTERLRALHERAAPDPAQTDALEERIEALTRLIDAQGMELLKLRKTSASLREELAAIRDAAAVDAHLVNRAMLAELEALRAERGAEALELAAIMAELEPIVAGG